MKKIIYLFSLLMVFSALTLVAESVDSMPEDDKVITEDANSSGEAIKLEPSRDAMKKPVDNKQPTKKSGVKVMPSLLLEHKSFIFMNPEFDHNDNQTELFAGALFKFNDKVGLKPFVKTLVLWGADSTADAEFELDELSFGTSIVYKPLPWMMLAATVATANVFEADQNI